MTKFDKIVIISVVFIFLSIVISAMVKNIVGGVVIALLLTIFITVMMLHFVNRRKKNSYQSIINMQNNLSIYGLAYQQDLLFRAVPPYFSPVKDREFIIVSLNTEKNLFYSCFRFGGANFEDVSKCFRYAKEKEIKKCRILSQLPQRKILTLSRSLDIDISFIPPRKYHSYLKKHNISLPKIAMIKHKKIPLKVIIKQSFTQKRARYFFLACLSLCLFAIISPYKIYYLIMAGILLAGGFICAFMPN